VPFAMLNGCLTSIVRIVTRVSAALVPQGRSGSVEIAEFADQMPLPWSACNPAVVEDRLVLLT
jgi:hypothetical protein